MKSRFVTAVTLLAGVLNVIGGAWAMSAPRSFAEFTAFPPHEHFVHDLGAFQLGAGATLLLALIWADTLATVLAGFLVLDVAHVRNHVIDADLGGSTAQTWLLVVLAVLVLAALVVRVRQLGLVLGAVTTSATGPLTAYARQKTIRLTTFRRDGRPVGTAVSIAVDGDHAYVRSFERAGKSKRLRHTPRAEIAPSDARGRATGPALDVELTRLDGAEDRRAARLIRRKHPVLHGVLVPFAHRAGRSKTGRTVHFRVEPARVTARSGPPAPS